MKIENYSKKAFGFHAKDWSILGSCFDKLKSERKGKTFAQIQAEDPDQAKFQNWDSAAVKAGSALFSEHKAKVSNYQLPGHEQALKLHTEKFGSSDELALAHFISYCRKTMGAEKRFIPNVAYENSLFQNLTFPTSEDQNLGNKLRGILRKKWDAFGDQGDGEFIENFIQDHPFSKDPRGPNFKTADSALQYDTWRASKYPSSSEKR
ncbi:MAG: hypothetical protein IM572_06285 [Chitinophagaceae bacterium]|nr:hypothetical protein [Microcystis sp. M065S1]MCA6492266.1 hypothetical protein [Chitinophagaceae bacterium]